jgi:serine protease inhibitor
MPVDQSAEREKQLAAQKEALTKLLDDQNQVVAAARISFTNAKTSLPSDDPEIENLKSIWVSEVGTLKKLLDQAKKLA